MNYFYIYLKILSFAAIWGLGMYLFIKLKDIIQPEWAFITVIIIDVILGFTWIIFYHISTKKIA